MPGNHQLDNAKTAYTLAQILSARFTDITENSIVAGLSSVSLPCRFEIVDDNIVLDAAHNGDSAAALVKTLETVFPKHSAVFILGVNQDKNLQDIFFSLQSKAKMFIATRSNNYRALPPEELRDKIIALAPGTEIICQNNIESAISIAKDKNPETIICVCGSFYLAAAAREYLLGSPKISLHK